MILLKNTKCGLFGTIIRSENVNITFNKTDCTQILVVILCSGNPFLFIVSCIKNICDNARSSLFSLIWDSFSLFIIVSYSCIRLIFSRKIFPIF
eukprot:UN27634